MEVPRSAKANAHASTGPRLATPRLRAPASAARSISLAARGDGRSKLDAIPEQAVPKPERRQPHEGKPPNTAVLDREPRRPHLLPGLPSSPLPCASALGVTW